MLRRKLLRDLRRQAAQAGAIAITLFLGALLLVASFDAYRNLRASYAKVFRVTQAADLYVSGGNVDAIARAARGTPGVAAVVTRSVADVPLRIGDAKLLGRVVGVPAGRPDVNRLLLRSGSLDGGIVVERHLAADFDLGVGDEIEVAGRTLRVAGVADSVEYLWPARSRQDVLPAPKSFGVVFAPEPLARELAGPPSETLIRYADGVGAAAPTARLTRAVRSLGAAAVTTRADQASNAALQTDIDGFRELAVFFPLLFFAAAALATGVLLSRRVRAERRLIGTLRASGLDRRRILGHYLGFGLVLAVAGGLTGAVAGALAASAITRLYTGELGIPLAVTSVHASTAAVGFGLTLVVAAAAAAGPAWAAARTPPAEAMRSSAPPGRGGRSLVERLVPPLGRLPVRYRHVLRSLGRNRRRSASTVLAVVLAAILVLVGWGMLDTTEVLLARQFDRVDRQDATVTLVRPVDEAGVAAVEGVAGVAAAEIAARAPAAVSSDGRSYGTSLLALPPATTMHGFPDPELLEHGLVVGSALRGVLGVRRGDEVQVRLAGGGSFRAPVAGFVDEPLGTYAYVGLPLLERLAPAAAQPNELLVRFRSGADRDAVLHRLAALDEVASVTDTNALEAVFRTYLGLFYAFVGVMLVFAAALAFTIMFVTTSANLAERAVEVTTLEASGVDYRKLARLLRTENLLLTLLGIAVGLPVAVLVARWFMASYSSDLFRFDLALKPRTPLLAAAALLAVALASELPGLRALRRTDVAAAVRERGD